MVNLAQALGQWAKPLHHFPYEGNLGGDAYKLRLVRIGIWAKVFTAIPPSPLSNCVSSAFADLTRAREKAPMLPILAQLVGAGIRRPA